MSNKNSRELNTSQTWKVWKMMLLFVLRRCFIWTLCIIWQTTATTLPCLPAVYPHDNTWSIFAQKDITVEFVHVLTGAHGGKQWKVRIKTFQNGATKLQNQWTPPGVHWLGADLLDVFLTCLNSFSRSAGLYDLGPAKSLTAERVIITIWRIDK